MKKAMSDGLKRAAKAWLIGTALPVALMLMAGLVAPSMAENSLEQDLGIIRACGSEVSKRAQLGLAILQTPTPTTFFERSNVWAIMHLAL
jgi:hypothetical protein